MNALHKQLQDLETDLIEVIGLMEALKRLHSDDGAHICVANALDGKLSQLQQGFYKHWRSVNDGDSHEP